MMPSVLSYLVSAILSHLNHLHSCARQNSSIASLITRQRTIWFPDDRCTVMRLCISQMTHLLSHGHDRMGMISLVFLLLDGIHMLSPLFLVSCHLCEFFFVSSFFLLFFISRSCLLFISLFLTAASFSFIFNYTASFF